MLISHPLFWDEDFPAAQRMGLALKAATPSPETSYEVLATAFGMQGTSLEVPQSLIYERSAGALSPIYRKSGSLNWQSTDIMARLKRQIG